jgi:serine/threonine protein kinase
MSCHGYIVGGVCKYLLVDVCLFVYLYSENILYSIQENAVKVIDFGLCTKCVAGQKELDDFCGSPGFFAPEILLQEKYDGQKADVWSIGCILLEMILGNNMFVSLWMGMYELNILKDRRKFAELLRKSLLGVRELCQINSKFPYSNKLKSLLMALLTEKPHERLSVYQMLMHPWFGHEELSSTFTTTTTTTTTGSSPTKACSTASHSPKRSPSPVKTKSMTQLLKPMTIHSQSPQPQVQQLQQLPQQPVVYLPESSSRIRPLSAEDSTKLSLPSISGSSPEKSSTRKTSTTNNTTCSGGQQYDWPPNN